MKNYDRIFVIVLDSLGIGAMPDSAKFGDIGVDTFGHILEKMEMCIRDRPFKGDNYDVSETRTGFC